MCPLELRKNSLHFRSKRVAQALHSLRAVHAIPLTKNLTVEVGDTALAYRESGRGDPLVLVHASLSDLRSWEPIEPQLAAYFRTINYSRRFAFPNQQITEGTDEVLAQHARDLIALIENLRLGKVHLVGNSSGAFVCLLAAKQRPDLIRTLTLEEPPVISMFLKSLPPKPGEMLKLLFTAPTTLLALIKAGAGAIGPATKAFANNDNERALELFSRGVLGAATYAKITPARKQQMLDNLAAHRAALLGSGLPVFTAKEAATLQLPTQLLYGSDTPIFQQRINRRLAESMPDATNIRIAGASHLVHEDNPEAVATAIIDFCRYH